MLLKEGSELSDKFGQLKMPSSDGKNYKTDVSANAAHWHIPLITQDKHSRKK